MSILKPFSDRSLASMGEALYTSATTLVFRMAAESTGGHVVCKEYIGADGLIRLDHEKSTLARLAGVGGVVQLAPGSHPPRVLALVDCSGAPLAEALNQGALDPGMLLPVAIQLAATLADVHRLGVIHGDINPWNILLCPDGQPVLIDFDRAMLAESMAQRQAGVRVGRLPYMAPEQTGRTGHAVDQRTDLYSLGATLYEMVTGKLPFEGQDALQLIHDHLLREPVAPSQVEPQVHRKLSEIILRLLAKAPEQRYQSAEGVRHDLLRLHRELQQGGSGVFELGEADFDARLAAPAHLVGRDAESAMLRAAFADALRTPRRTVLIEGAAGVGKSALIHALRPFVAAAGGWFVQGKFDQYQKDGSTAEALTQALRALGRLLLAQPLDELKAYRMRIVEGLGGNLGLITELMPEFALLLGHQPEVRETDPRQAELLVQEAMVDLVGAIASPDRPLVIVLDDLQWAGGLSLRAFERLMRETSLRGCFLVGAYRADEADAGRELSLTLAQWRRHREAPMEIALASLTPAATSELIGQMLRLASGPAGELAKAVGALTAGNPFDTVEMVNALRRDGLLRLGEQGWRWDSAAIRRFVGRGNVVDLLAARIARLPQASRELLELMSCLGNAVERKLLREAAGLDDAELRDRLHVPLEDGLLLSHQGDGHDSVGFRHDRVQQAVLDAMDDAHRCLLQLQMARRLAAVPHYESDAAQQYLACIPVLRTLGEPQEHRLAARLFFELAQKLAGGATYMLAERYLSAASGLLAAGADPADAGLCRAIDAARHAALYSLGRLDESDPLYAAMQARTTDPLDLVEPACLQIRSLFIRGEMTQAMELGLHLLVQLGLEVPPGYTAPDTERQLDALHEWIRQEGRPGHPRRRQIRDPRLLAKAKLLGRTTWAANYRSDLKAFVWLMLENQRMWVAHGPCPDLVATLSRMSNMLVSVREDFRGGYDIARHVMSEGEALGWEPQTSEARAIFTIYACHWFEPLENALNYGAQAYEGVKAKGDVSYGCYLHASSLAALLDVASVIDSSDARLEANMVLCQRYGNHHAAALNMGERQLLRALRGQTSSPGSFDDQRADGPAFAPHLADSPYVGHTYHVRRALCALLFGDVSALARHASSALSFVRTIPGYYTAAHAHLFTALARAWQVQQRPHDASMDWAPLLAELESSRRWLAGRARDQSDNFLHLLRLVEAEQAWALGDLWKANLAFDEAMLEAGWRRRPWHRALITERAAMFHMANGLPHVGHQLLAQALGHYQAWGATGKVAQMRREHPFLGFGNAVEDSHAGPAAARGHDSKNVSSDALDLMGVLRASQALSSETSLERLASRVTEVLAALSGATKVLVLSCNDGQWWLVAPAQGESSISVAQASERGLMPASAFGYAERTGEVLMVDDASSDDRFARDPYFTGVPLCSLLVAPISSQGSLRGMLLLENRLRRAAFSDQRLDAVKLIAGQLAVSLANVQLYESLEQRVQARTHELQETQARLVATARQAGKAEIANNVIHNVGNVLNSVNVSAQAVRDAIRKTRAEGLTRAVALLNAHAADLADFIGHDPQGKALLLYLNELDEALRAERQGALVDLDRLTHSVDHIAYVVAAQQSHAGPSSLLETVRPQDLLEEALRLCGETIGHSGMVVVRRFEEMPALLLDKSRLLQILVNLIGNAAQAMANAPSEARELTLTTNLVHHASGKRLRISVQDRGEGISAENLERLFTHGFTTRDGGHGFGLHSSALAAAEMGGRLTANSKGAGQGATFTLDLPVAL
jgi:signal transduction histidine kinase